MIGTSVDRYEILEELGHGGMSVVYRGLDSSLEREVAVKVLHNHLAKKAENRRRFHREAQAIARLRHRNILEIYDFSSEDAARSYIVMEYIAGENLRQFVGRTGTPPPEIAALLGVEICNALEHAHDHGIIHRDLKPENVMISSSGDVKLMDFGIAHVIDAETMTATGSLMGSPAHMAPELIDGEKVDVRSDVFALGTVLYWLATGALPFDGANAPQVLKRVLAGDYDEIDLVEPRVGRRFGAIIECCLSRSPADRYPSVSAVRKELVAFAASLGLSDAQLELKKYIAAPDAYVEEFDELVVDRLLQLARQAERERDVTAAIAIFNRVLAYDPTNREVQRLLDRLCRQDRLRRFGLPAFVLLALIGGVGAWLMTRPPPPATPAPPPVVTLPSDAAASASEMVATSTETAHDATIEGITRVLGVATDEVRLAIAKSQWRTEGRAPFETLRATAVPRAIKINTRTPDVGVIEADIGIEPKAVTHIWRFPISPAAATFTINGEPVELLRAGTGIPLPEGRHVLMAKSKGAKTWTKRIEVSAPGLLPIALEWQPARVDVRSNINAVVWFDGAADPSPIGQRRTFTVPFGPADSTENSRRITVRAAHVDNVGRSQTQRVNVTAGNVYEVMFTFDHDP